MAGKTHRLEIRVCVVICGEDGPACEGLVGAGAEVCVGQLLHCLVTWSHCSTSPNAPAKSCRVCRCSPCEVSNLLSSVAAWTRRRAHERSMVQMFLYKFFSFSTGQVSEPCAWCSK